MSKPEPEVGKCTDCGKDSVLIKQVGEERLCIMCRVARKPLRKVP